MLGFNFLNAIAIPAIAATTANQGFVNANTTPVKTAIIVPIVSRVVANSSIAFLEYPTLVFNSSKGVNKSTNPSINAFTTVNNGVKALIIIVSISANFSNKTRIVPPRSLPKLAKSCPTGANTSQILRKLVYKLSKAFTVSGLTFTLFTVTTLPSSNFCCDFSMVKNMLCISCKVPLIVSNNPLVFTAVPITLEIPSCILDTRPVKVFWNSSLAYLKPSIRCIISSYNLPSALNWFTV